MKSDQKVTTMKFYIFFDLTDQILILKRTSDNAKMKLPI